MSFLVYDSVNGRVRASIEHLTGKNLEVKLRTIIKKISLTDEDHSLSLTDLTKKYPLED